MYFEYGVGRMPIRMTQNSATYYFAYDQVGSLRAVFDSSGNVVHEITYDSYGNILSETTAQGYEDLCVPFGFAGGLHDRDTGMVLFGFRDYDPETGTWLTPDPIGFAGGDTYLYGYCGGDPVNRVDSNGLIYDPGLGLFRERPNVAEDIGDFVTGLYVMNAVRNWFNSPLPPTAAAAGSPKWGFHLRSQGKDVCHRLGEGHYGNQVWEHPDGREVTYNAEGTKIIHGSNQGTYDYFNSEDHPIMHFLVDFGLYAAFGAGLGDDRPFIQRVFPYPWLSNPYATNNSVFMQFGP